MASSKVREDDCIDGLSSNHMTIKEEQHLVYAGTDIAD